MRCSIVIRSYNEASHIGRLLEGILQQTIKDIEIILVDSGSTDNTLEVAGNYPVTVFQIPPEDFTFGRSLNAGISHASADLVVIASGHVYPVYPDWLDHLLAPFADPEIALTYGMQRGNSETKFSEQQVFNHWFPEVSDQRQMHPFCNNANAAIRRALWQIQPYDETLSGLEDIAWANWVLKEGYAISYVAEAEIIHAHDETPHDVFNRYRREAMAFKRIYPQESFSRWDFAHLVTTNIGSDLWMSAREGSIWRHFSGILWFRWMQFWGTYEGYRQSGPLTWELRKTFYYPHGVSTSSAINRRDVEPIEYDN